MPEVPAPGLDGATVRGFDECLRHNEMELALDELEDLGLTNAPPPEFWRHLMRHVKVKPDLALDELSLEAVITSAYRDILERLKIANQAGNADEA